MFDQGVLFRFSVVMVIGAIAVAVLIGISGHVAPTRTATGSMNAAERRPAA